MIPFKNVLYVTKLKKHSYNDYYSGNVFMNVKDGSKYFQITVQSVEDYYKYVEAVFDNELKNQENTL